MLADVGNTALCSLSVLILKTNSQSFYINTCRTHCSKCLFIKVLNPLSNCVIVYRKRFEKAEAEYVAAKLDLHRKTEVKEQLTEHLCAIIQQNELRKALKLEELMLQLELDAEVVSNPEETKQEKESEDNSQSVTENGPTEGMEGRTEVDGSNLSKDSPITEPKISQDNQEIRATDVSTDVPS